VKKGIIRNSEMLLKTLREEVLEANLELVRRSCSCRLRGGL
jgi:hypothetical protein